MRRLLAVAFVVVLLVGSVPVAAVSGALPARDAPAVAESVDGTNASDSPRLNGAPQTLGVTDEFDSVEFHITVYGNGTAEWTFMYQRTLNNDSERQQFREFADGFNNNSTAMWRDFKTQAQELASAGQNFTNRTMQAQNFRKEARVGGLMDDNRGIVTMTFQWTGFTHSDGETVIVGDVFQGGLYIGPNQSLVVRTGPELKFTSVDPSEPALPSGEGLADSTSVTWEGEYDFNDQRPRVKFDPVEGTTTTSVGTTGLNTTSQNGSGGAGGGDNGDGGPTATTAATTTASQPSQGDDWSPIMMFVGAVVVLLGLAAAFAWRQGDFGDSLSSGDGGNPGGDGGAAASGATAGSGSPEPSVSDEELLTDEARVKKLLGENGGRMKQVNIVEETGWSKSKVSMLLSEMEDEGEISKLRVGRENIISLEGHEPDAAGSPLEE
ncbi:helix-turn-helix transcriptional regulator [Halorussus litoreus]|uniref:helix-turn-helix transcriptional regulator n=1 Tax=Halorussus litoreus TaxID=1710536 RepID=UPI000E262D9E|nr:hypothetical protein [Halorussus litoreus]